MKFNHVAVRVDDRAFEVVSCLFKEQLGFRLLRRTDRSIWLRQEGATIDLQLSRSQSLARDEDKLRSQVSFLSDAPAADLHRLARWLEAKGIEARVGSYSASEYYLDAPDAFIDFVVEAMLPALADYGPPD